MDRARSVLVEGDMTVCSRRVGKQIGQLKARDNWSAQE